LAVAGIVCLTFAVSLQRWPAHPEIGDQSWDALGVPWLDGYVRWDGGWYYNIAGVGYFYGELRADGRIDRQTPVPFFPLYPLMIRACAAPFDPPPPATSAQVLSRSWVGGVVAGIAICLVAGLVYVQLLMAWSARWFTGDTAQVIAITVVCYPLSFFLMGPIYSEALFCLLAVAAFRMLEDDRRVLAALFGALASATRPVGVALVIGLVIGALERSQVLVRRENASAFTSLLPRLQLSRWRWSDALLLSSALGGLAYWLYLWRFASPTIPGWRVYTLAASADGWYMKPGPAVWLKFEAWRQLLGQWFDPAYQGDPAAHGLKQLMILFHLGLTLFGFACVPAIIRRFGWGLAAYTTIALLIPAISSKDFIAMGRYLLPCFPVFALAGAWIARCPRWLQWATWSSGLVAMIWFASRFVRWYYVT
jgi:hypothetical protein